MIYPRNQTTQNMAALLRKLKRMRRVPHKVRVYPSGWKNQRRDYLKMARLEREIRRSMSRRMRDD